MTKQPKEPTILDRINNAVTSNRTVQRGLLQYAQGLLPDLLEAGFNLPLTRIDLCKKLTEWLYSRGFTGRSTNKLVSKTAAKTLKTYEGDLRAKLRAKARQLSKEGWFGESQADAILADLAQGKVGKGRDRWLRRW